MHVKKAVNASVVRFCYVAHGAIGVFLTVYLEQNGLYWFIAILLLVYMIEMYVTYSCNEDGEWKWFFPLVVIYLATVLPVVWILEVSLLDFRIELQSRLNLTSCIVRPTSEFAIGVQLGVCNYTGFNFPESEKNTYNTKLSISTIYQQTLMLTLILGRWLLPKGGLTRDELSQLLLVYIGMAADMLEFSSETLKLEQIACSRRIYVSILAVWSWSLLQFTLGLTSTKRRRRTLVMSEEETGRWTKSIMRDLSGVFCGTALWALMTDVILQDGPYLIMRLYLLFVLRLVDQSLIFFTCKNALLVVLQFYRLYVVMTETKQRALTHRQRAKLRLRKTRSYGNSQLSLRQRKRSGSGQCMHGSTSSTSSTNLKARGNNGVVASISQEITIME